MPASLFHIDSTDPAASPGCLEDQRALQLALELSLLGLSSESDPLSGSFDPDSRGKKSQNTTECVPVPSSEHVAEIVGRQGKFSHSFSLSLGALSFFSLRPLGISLYPVAFFTTLAVAFGYCQLKKSTGHRALSLSFSLSSLCPSPSLLVPSAFSSSLACTVNMLSHLPVPLPFARRMQDQSPESKNKYVHQNPRTR